METWMTNELVRSIPKEKLEFLTEVFQSSKGKSKAEWMNEVLPRIKAAKEKGLVFTPTEMTAAIAAIRASSSAEENKKIDAFLKRLDAEAARANSKPSEKVRYNVRDNSRKLSFKEKREMELLTTEIDQLSNEKKQLDMLFASGKVINDMDTKSARYNELQKLLDEKELRWLELSEKEQ